jgi:transposase
MRRSSTPVRYLVGTPKGRLTQLEQDFVGQPWAAVRESVDVKLLQQPEELYVLARSQPRMLKERRMRQRRLKKLWQRLRQLQHAPRLTRDQLLLKLGAAKKDAGRAWSLVKITVPPADQTRSAQTLRFELRRDKLRQVRRREGRYLLRTNLTEEDPARLWQYYIQLTEVEQAFKELKSDLAIRPIYHQTDARIEAHIFVAFVAYCLQVTLKQRLRALAPGLTPRAVIEELSGIQMVDVRLPTTDGRQLVLSRYTQPETEQTLLLQQLQLKLPAQSPPRILASAPAKTA